MVSPGQAKILSLKCLVWGLGTRACRASPPLHHGFTPSASSRRLLPPASSLASEERLGSVLPAPDTYRLEPSSLGQQGAGGSRAGERESRSRGRGSQEEGVWGLGTGIPRRKGVRGSTWRGRLQGIGDPEVEGAPLPGGAGPSAEPAAPRI